MLIEKENKPYIQCRTFTNVLSKNLNLVFSPLQHLIHF